VEWLVCVKAERKNEGDARRPQMRYTVNTCGGLGDFWDTAKKTVEADKAAREARARRRWELCNSVHPTVIAEIKALPFAFIHPSTVYSRLSAPSQAWFTYNAAAMAAKIRSEGAETISKIIGSSGASDRYLLINFVLECVKNPPCGGIFKPSFCSEPPPATAPSCPTGSYPDSAFLRNETCGARGVMETSPGCFKCAYALQTDQREPGTATVPPVVARWQPSDLIPSQGVMGLGQYAVRVGSGKHW
jgi:hypothetical protein